MPRSPGADFLAVPSDAHGPRSPRSRNGSPRTPSFSSHSTAALSPFSPSGYDQSRHASSSHRDQAPIKLAQPPRRNRPQLRSPINKLPVELLSRILELGYTPDVDGIAYANVVSHVDRRFRQVAFFTTSLWSTVSNSQAPKELKKYIERSKCHPLTITINEDPLKRQTWESRKGLDYFVDILLSHADRWVEFRYTEKVYSGDYDHEILNSHKGLKLPTLTTLCHQSVIDYQENAPPPYIHWLMPNLHTYNGENVLPFLGYRMPLYKFNLRLTDYCTPRFSDCELGFLLDCLWFMPFLRQLCVHFDYLDMNVSKTPYERCSLVHLTHLFLTITKANPQEVCTQLFPALDTPKLTTLVLQTHDTEVAGGYPEWLTETFGATRFWSTLESVAIIVDHVVSWEMLCAIVQRMPQLHHFTLFAMEIKVSPTSYPVQEGRLRGFHARLADGGSPMVPALLHSLVHPQGKLYLTRGKPYISYDLGM